MNKEYIVQRTCTEVYKVKANSAEQAEEYIANNPSEFSMIGGETIDIEVDEVEDETKKFQLLPFYSDSKENLALHLQTIKLHDLMFSIREVGVDEMTWEAAQKEADDWYKE